MLFFTLVRVALRSLTGNPLRTILAMLGIIIGVGAVISMLAIGAGSKKQIMDRISAMGTDLLIVRPAQRSMGGVSSGTSEGLTLDDATAILKEVKNVLQVAPGVSGNAQAKYLNKNTRTTVLGTTVTYLGIRDFTVEKGRAFTEGEVNQAVRVALLGPVVATALFDTEDPLGKTIRLGSVNFTVVGVLKSKGDQGWANPDDQVIVPLPVAMKQMFGQTFLREINVQAVPGSDQTAIQNDILSLIRKRHNRQPEDDDDIQIRNQADIVDTASAITKTFTLLLGSIASISLIVGGIGIMNIMLVTVTERTREIGVRKAVGAQNRDILGQFLIESIIISGAGGLLGVAMGVGVALLIPKLTTSFTTSIEPMSGVLAFTVSAAVGVFFGWYPAARAAKLDPIEALRYE